MFIGADIGMRELQEKQRVDVLDILISMRQDRGGMVQTRDQYVLLYKVSTPPVLLELVIGIYYRFCMTMERELD